MSQTITVIPGDGIGPEVTQSVIAVLKAADADLEYDEQIAGLVALKAVSYTHLRAHET